MQSLPRSAWSFRKGCVESSPEEIMTVSFTVVGCLLSTAGRNRLFLSHDLFRLLQETFRFINSTPAVGKDLIEKSETKHILTFHFVDPLKRYVKKIDDRDYINVTLFRISRRNTF